MNRNQDRSGFENQKSNLVSFFWWSLLISILTAVVVLSWVSSIYIFNNPNEKIPYKILNHFNKLEPIKKFSKTSPPQSKLGFRTLRELMEKEFSNLSGVYLSFQNERLLKNYIQNYKIKNSIYYVKGNFKISNIRALNKSDLFTQGIAIEANSKKFPKTSAIFILPTAKSQKLDDLIGSDLILSSDAFSSVLHLENTSEEKMLFTLIPIVYGNFKLTNSQSLNLIPPKELNIEGNWPIKFD